MKVSLNPERELLLFSKERVTALGVDEVGRGALAGPVVAAAVLFDWGKSDDVLALAKEYFICDSKVLTRNERKKAALAIRGVAKKIGIGAVEPAVIDDINILQATLTAMRHAVLDAQEEPIASREFRDSVPQKPTIVLVDGQHRIPELPLPQDAIIDGDALFFSIAAASIVAKEYRDALMEQFDATHPGYNFASHKGYGTVAHRKAIKKLGLSPLHRRTFWHG